MAKLSPVFNDQTIDANGAPAVGYKLFTYAAGSSTKQTTFSDEAGTVPNSNPIILNADGWPTQGPIWLTEGQAYKFVLALPDDSDPPTSPVKTIDNVSGVGDSTVSVSQWQASGATPTYISANSFSLLGDQTTEFHKGRRLQFVVGSGVVYGKIINSVFATLTTVTVLLDGVSTLDSGLSSVSLSILRADHTALPNPIEKLLSTVAATATTTPLWDRAYGEVQNWTGVVTITDFPAAPQAGSQREVYPAVGAIITNAGNISVQGGANYTVAAGDKLIVTAITTTTFYVAVVKKDGTSVGMNFASTSDMQTGTSIALVPSVNAIRQGLRVRNSMSLSGATVTVISNCPTWASRIVIIGVSVATGSSSVPRIQLGDAGGLENSGYVGSNSRIAGGTSAAVEVFPSTGFAVYNSSDWAAATVCTFKAVLERYDDSSNAWHATINTNTTNASGVSTGCGVKSLSQALTSVAVITGGTFSGGTVYSYYE